MQQRTMKDWSAYLKSKIGTPMWGAIALDFYQKEREDQDHANETYLKSRSDFLDWLIEELCTPDCDPILFHSVFVNLAVRMLSADFKEIMTKSIKVLSKFGGGNELVIRFQEDYVLFKQDFGKFLTGSKTLAERTKASNSDIQCGDDKCIRICHISDIHFGIHHDLQKFNMQTPKGFPRTDYFLDFLSSQNEEGRGFDLLIISGDITSIAADDEFEQFHKFLDKVGKTEALPQDSFWDRIILVPGNHDVLRRESRGKKTGGDRLKHFQRFAEKLAKKDKHIRTPFSSEGKGSFGECAISFKNDEGAATALHVFPEIGTEILTLISCYYSQDLDSKVVDLINNLDRLKKQAEDKKLTKKEFESIAEFLTERIYLDGGIFPSDLSTELRAKLREYYRVCTGTNNRIKLVVAHHNGSNYCSPLVDVSATVHFDMLDSIFARQGFRYYLHGHIHEAVPISNNTVREISCRTLGGFITKGYHGFNILEFGAKESELQRWQLKGNKFKLEERIQLSV